MENLEAERAAVEEPTEWRILVRSMWQASGLIHDPSPRQLPTDHDHDGELHARSANIRVINRRVSYLDRRLFRSKKLLNRT